MRNIAEMELSYRQRAILRGVVEEYVANREPVGSRTLVERIGLDVSPSTVRGELAELERQGLLTHPHTSAGRVPTEQGYRYYADRLLERMDPQPGGFPLDLTTARNEVDSALQATTEMLSELTRLLALVSAPPLGTATVRHVEVILLQPQVAMVVVITSTGSVTKRVYRFADPVDPGLVNWATQYLNDRVAGLELGSNALRRRVDEPGLGARETTFLATLRPLFDEALAAEEQSLYVGGTAGLLEDLRGHELESYQRLLEVLEKRAALLEVLSQALDSRRPFVRVGPELEHPGLRDLSLVGASYGLTTRTLGAVTLLGPVRMDYDKALRSVRAAAHELSRFVEELYDDN
ncbi:MAG TPA: heat-inducible transcriptional repressor HrcA [Gaiellaceae bacterium]|jgi:heat-inducible transcriptional repressor|nr:heat-inducible transcriptional repressor HrcA [Gaiellaceae bacterium]